MGMTEQQAQRRRELIEEFAKLGVPKGVMLTAAEYVKEFMAHEAENETLQPDKPTLKNLTKRYESLQQQVAQLAARIYEVEHPTISGVVFERRDLLEQLGTKIRILNGDLRILNGDLRILCGNVQRLNAQVNRTLRERLKDLWQKWKPRRR